MNIETVSPTTSAPEIKRMYDASGYCVLPAAFTADEVAALQEETTAICRGGRGDIQGAEALAAELTADEVLQQFLCIHFPHKFSAPMRATLFNPAVLRVLTAAVGPNVKCMQSMLFIKASGKPGQAWHQDEDYIPTRDRSLIGAWIALDRATVKNGCLWIIPGSHRPGILWDQHWHGDRRFDCSEESRGFPYSDSDAIPVEVEAGTVVFFNGYTLHRSLPNRASAGTYRRALVNHFMSAESFLPWRPPEAKISMAKADYRDVLIVAGKDPYAARGYVDLAKPMLRRDGRSGCVSWTTGETVAYRDDDDAED